VHQFSTVSQIHPKVRKPSLKINNFSAFLTIDFRNMARTTSDRREANYELCHAELGSASTFERE
jgi:hypothetical protein